MEEVEMTSYVTLLMMTKAIDQDHRRMFLKEAAISHALKASRNGNRRPSRLLMRTGNLLVAAGCKLRERAMPPMYSSPEVRHSGC
jgi:hypothetical protein